MGDRANKFIGLLSERYTGLSLGSRARCRSRGTEKGDGVRKKRSGRRLSRGRARKIVKTLYNTAEGRYSGHLDDGGERKGRGREKIAERSISGGGLTSARFNEGW